MVCDMETHVHPAGLLCFIYLYTQIYYCHYQVGTFVL